MVTLAVLFLAVFTLFLLYKWIKINDNYFVERRVESLKPNFFIGNTLGFLIKKYVASEFISGIYNQFPNERCAELSVFFCCYTVLK